MSNNNVVNEKKKAMIAYKEKLLEEIKYYEKSINEFHMNHKNNTFYEDHVDSSDSEDEFPFRSMDNGPDVPQLKLQLDQLKTCLQATQELTSLTVLQSEVSIMVEEPKLEGERPVTEEGTWREVTAECRVDLVPFTINFFMHTPTRKFGQPSFRGLRVVPVKSAHELELSKSVLHTVKVPSDAIEVMRSYAAGYRSRRTSLARLANKYANALFMEPHPEGGFVLKCADLLEVSWRLENKRSQVAPFHHRMKFDLEYMNESYIKTITQAHKQLLDPAIQTDERTLLLAKIISTCLEARGPVDPESDVESKTTERDTDIEKRDSESEKRDSEVMAPPKSLPKKVKQKTQNQSNPAQKRTMNDENNDGAAKKIKKNDMPSAGLQNSADSNSKRSINDMVNEVSKKSKTNDGNDKNKVASNKSTIEAGNIDNKTVHTQPKNLKDIGNTENKVTNAKTKNAKETSNARVKNVKEIDNKENKDASNKPVNVKDTNNIKKTGNTKVKNLKGTEDTADKNYNIKETGNKDSNVKSKKKNLKVPTNTEKDITKNVKKDKDQIILKNDNIEADEPTSKSKTNTVKETGGNIVKIDTNKPKKSIVKEVVHNNKNIIENKTKKITTKVLNVKNKENGNAVMNSTEGNKAIEKKNSVANVKNTESNLNKQKSVTTKSKDNNVVRVKNDEVVKATEKQVKSKEKVVSRNFKDKQNVIRNIEKKVVEKNAMSNKIKDKISPVTNKMADKVVTGSNTIHKTVPVTIKQNKDTKENKEMLINKIIIKEPIKTMTHKIASHRTTSKVPNLQLKAGNIKTLTSGKTSKIPLKKWSPFSGGSSKKNI